VIRLAGQGAAHGNGKRSDLLLEIDYKPHGEFEVDGRNILFTLPLAPWEAALGTRVSVPTLGGQVDLRVPPDSDSGQEAAAARPRPAGQAAMRATRSSRSR
jgi:curved DNA-binding protein